jgi:hypothetical protein
MGNDTSKEKENDSREKRSTLENSLLFIHLILPDIGEVEVLFYKLYSHDFIFIASKIYRRFLCEFEPLGIDF